MVRMSSFPFSSSCGAEEVDSRQSYSTLIEMSVGVCLNPTPAHCWRNSIQSLPRLQLLVSFQPDLYIFSWTEWDVCKLVINKQISHLNHSKVNKDKLVLKDDWMNMWPRESKYLPLSLSAHLSSLILWLLADHSIVKSALSYRVQPTSGHGIIESLFSIFIFIYFVLLHRDVCEKCSVPVLFWSMKGTDS